MGEPKLQTDLRQLLLQLHGPLNDGPPHRVLHLLHRGVHGGHGQHLGPERHSVLAHSLLGEPSPARAHARQGSAGRGAQRRRGQRPAEEPGVPAGEQLHPRGCHVEAFARWPGATVGGVARSGAGQTVVVRVEAPKINK